MKKFGSLLMKIIIAICEAGCGILLLINPISFTSAIICGVGIVLALSGVIEIINYFRLSPEDAMKRQSLAKGLLGIIAGVFLVFKTEAVIVTFPIISILYGAALLVVGIVKLQWTVDFIRIKRSNWWLTGISALLSILFAVIILCNPFTTVAAVLMFSGITLICSAVIDVIAAVVSNVGKKAEKPAKTVEAEAEKAAKGKE